MHWPSLVRSSARSLTRNKVRSALMMAGVIAGIAALTTLSSVGASTRRETMKRFRNMLGTYDTVIVRPGSGKNRGMVTLANADPTLKFQDADAIAQLPAVKRVAELQDAFDVDVTWRDRTRTPAIFGVSPNWLDLRGDTVAEGSFITDDNNRSMARVAVLGADARRDLFPDQDPIGKTIRIGDVPFLVTGVLEPRGAGPGGASLDNLILIPVSTASRRLFNRDFLTMLIVQIANPDHPATAIAQIRSLLRVRHRLPHDALDDFTLTSPAAIMAQVTRLGSQLRTLLVVLSVLATVVGGVVILSLTLIGVSERSREIGVRRAVGAARGAVMLQFLLESLCVSIGGGLLGIAIGIAGTQLVSAWQHLPFLIDARMVAACALISIALGLLAGIYPAWKASRIHPVEALRG
ncbi:MAG: ABC transporter permease [Acidobacteriota bacterium]|nr:ABC transporter permease [Acidobacteriota bacterium]